MSNASKQGIQVITRAANVLRSLEDEANGLTLGQIAQRVGLARSTVQRIGDALREEQFVIAASPTSGVRLGPALIRLAASAGVHFDHVTRPIMMELSQAIGETVDLSALKGQSAVFTDQVQGRHRLRTVSAAGKSFPLYCTANGKAILSILPDEQVERLTSSPMPKLAPNTITKRAELMKAIEICRRTGYAIDDEEHTEGISALGAGFIDPLGRAVALSIPIPTTRFKRLRAGLAERSIDALVMQGGTQDWLGGYVKWFTDEPATDGYPISVIFPREDLMTVVGQGPHNGRRALNGDNSEHRGVGLLRFTPSYSSVHYTRHYDATLIAEELSARGYRSVGSSHRSGNPCSH